MGNVLISFLFISFLLIEFFFTAILVVACAVDKLLPIEEYKMWFQNRNWFGKIYIFITIIFTIPAAIIIYITFFIIFLVTFIYTLGIKEEKK